jgi:hypothetical protein
MVTAIIANHSMLLKAVPFEDHAHMLWSSYCKKCSFERRQETGTRSARVVAIDNIMATI